MVVEKTQVFHYCEPGGGEGKREREREKEKQCGYVDSHHCSRSQTSQGSHKQPLERKANGTALGSGEERLTVGSRLDFP